MIDATPKEIDMLAKATEIQEMWQPSLYDMVAFDGEIYLIFEIDHCAQNIVCTTIDGMVFQIPPKNRDRDVVWIPSQDQMQHIRFDKQTNGSFIGLLLAMRRGIRKERAPSTGQLQICDTMYSAFGKQWNGNDWEII